MAHYLFLFYIFSIFVFASYMPIRIMESSLSWFRDPVVVSDDDDYYYDDDDVVVYVYASFIHLTLRMKETKQNL